MPSDPAASPERIAREILAWRRSGTPRRAFRGLAPDDLESAYRVQEALHALLAEAGEGPIAGHKIALTSRAMQEMVGVATPLAGALFASRVHRSPARLDAAAFLRLGIECEVAVRVARALPGAGGRCDRAGVAAAVDACAPAFELVEDGGVDYARLDAASLVADNCWNAGAVLGEWVEGGAERWLDGGFTEASTRLSINGEPAGGGRVGDAMGHPFEAVAWVAERLAARGRSLEAGAIVLTGSSVRTAFPVPGDRARLEIEGLGTVELTLREAPRAGRTGAGAGAAGAANPSFEQEEPDG